MEDFIAPQLRFSKVFYVNVTDLEGNYLYVNELFVKKFGFITDDFLGKSFADTISADDIQKSIEASIFCIENPKSTVPIVLKKPLPDGNFYYTQWEFSLLEGEKGDPLGIICVGFDMTIQEKQKNELLIKQKKALLFFNNPDKDNLILDLSGVIKEYNECAAKSIKKYNNKTVKVGDSIVQYLSKDYKDKFHEDVNQVKKGNPVSRELCLTFDTGESAWVIVNLIPILDNSGKIYEVFFSAKNINPLKSALSTKELLETKLKKIAWEHSHGVRSPLANILSLVDLIDSNDFDINGNEQEYILSSIKKEATRLDEIIHKLSNNFHSKDV